MATKKTTTPFVRTPAQQEADRIKRLERTQKRQQESPSSSSAPTTTSSTSEGGHDFLDGFEQSIGLFGDSQVANGEAGQIFDYRQGVLQLHLANVAGGMVKFMSHYVWNAALVMAEYVEAGDLVDVRGKRGMFFHCCSVQYAHSFTFRGFFFFFLVFRFSHAYFLKRNSD